MKDLQQKHDRISYFKESVWLLCWDLQKGEQEVMVNWVRGQQGWGVVLPRRLSGKESACKAGDLGLIPWVRKVSWRRKWQLMSVFLPGKSHKVSKSQTRLNTYANQQRGC